jgi:alkylation response protein AidB-like acyl-CoA dehydrogenase
MITNTGVDNGGRQALVVTAVRDVVPVLRRNAELSERRDRLTEETVVALRDSGCFRLGVPASLGGLEVGLTTCVRLTSELARACPSSAWVVAVSYGAQCIAALFGDRVRERLWGQQPDVAMCGAFAGAGVDVTRVTGGQEISGRWSWLSGVHHAEWALLGVPKVDARGDVVGQAMALAPIRDLSIEDTWDMAGMRGTGSHTAIAEGLFVPDERIVSLDRLVGGSREGMEPLYRIPIGAAAVTLAAPMLGAAREVFDLTMGIVAKGKPMAGSVYRHLADSAEVRANLAMAATLIDSAEMHLLRSADAVDRAATEVAEIDMVVRARARMDIGYASKCLRDAVQLLLSVSGASSFGRTSPLQRYWRDLETAARHPTISTELSRDIYGRALVGTAEQASFLL